MMGDFEVKLAEHDAEIKHLNKSIDRLADSSEKTNEKIDSLVEAVGQTAAILERIASIDTYNKDSVNRLHKRIDDTLDLITQKEKTTIAEIQKVAGDAKKGGIVYDFLVTFAKVTAALIPIIGVLWAGFVFFIDHYKG